MPKAKNPAEKPNKEKLIFPKPQNAPIAVSYRLEGKHLGKAAFYDHYTLQNHTGFPTAVAHSPDPQINMKPLGAFISTQTLNLPHSPIDADFNRPIPVELQSYQEGGLLFIPGMTRDSYEQQPEVHKIRMKFESQILRDALNRGRPILAVCAGTWTLWEALGGTIKPVKDHNYGGGMPRISATGKMTYNKHVHDVEITSGTLLYRMMDLADDVKARTLPANSIHWMAPDDSKIPTNFEVAAVSKSNREVAIQTRQQEKMSPEENTVEGFSSKFGAPVAAFLYHLEAFDWSSQNPTDVANNKCLLFMAQAGSAYEARLRMLNEYKNKIQPELQNEIDALASGLGKLKI